MVNNPTLVVVAYNRPQSLRRLLTSIQKSEYNNEQVHLIISIDFSDNNEVWQVAQDFQWEFGNKTLIKHEKKLGLRQHILLCGDLTFKYGSIIVLEDDLLVSPTFYKYAKAAALFYENNNNVAGISLYHHEHNETSKLPFQIIGDDYDTYFAQIPSSWGQLWTAKQWDVFRTWYNKVQEVTVLDYLPDNVIEWPGSSWKKFFFKFLVDTQSYFVYPKIAFSTNCGDAGEHHTTETQLHQTSLSIQSQGFRFPNLNDTINVYDQFFEIQPKSLKVFDNIDIEDIEVDVYGTKPLHKSKAKYTLSSKTVHQPIEAFTVDYFPINLNLLIGLRKAEIKNAQLFLSRTDTFNQKINSNFISLFASRVDHKTKEFLDHAQMKSIAKTDVYRIGHRILRFLDFLPFNLGHKFLNLFKKQVKSL